MWIFALWIFPLKINKNNTYKEKPIRKVLFMKN